ncbi:hypothetical protein [Rhodopirellula sp. MGV]|uniref:hypothetical protein n=1 Tax=Rhodopirellula sp. MGV TaxID=2023130 RepID=UPI000B961717|nr:hypothetical protein [Rhodopirellula sp. MGV]OYP33982.1 hypothetical protein CGZ80_17565 [Rhodopirellula sp. MGV]PNY37261.1 hypothetical protein C2E31_08865 [Rhodopirellula baltica]
MTLQIALILFLSLGIAIAGLTVVHERRDKLATKQLLIRVLRSTQHKGVTDDEAAAVDAD